MFAVPAFAQFDLVTGQVVDPNGIPYSGATLRAQLVINGANVTGQPTVTNASQAQCISAGLGNAPCQMPFPGTNSVTLDPAGNIPGGGLNLAHNPSVTPAGTQWLFSVTISPGIPPPGGTGPQSFAVPITINSNPINISATLDAAAPKLSNLASGSIIGTGPSTPGTCTVGQVFFNTTTNQLFVCSSPNVFTLVGGTGTVTTFSYSETQLDPLMASTVTNPTTTPNLNQAGTNVQPGQVLAGPPSTGQVGNPTFELSAVNNGTSTTPNVTGKPIVAASVALFFANSNSAALVNPGAGWTALTGTIGGSSVYFQNLASSSPLSASGTIGASSPWAASLAFLGGSITSSPQNISFISCGSGCLSGTFGGAETAGHTVIVYGTWNSSPQLPDLLLTDTLGNLYQLMLFIPTSLNEGHFAFVAQNVIAGTPTFTLKTRSSVVLGGAIAYELAGPSAYFAGPTGPWTFRFLNSGDLTAAGIPKVVSSYESFTFCASGCSVTGTPCATTTSANNECTNTITWPTAFPDTGYSPSCSGSGTITGFPFIPFVTKTSATQITVTTSNGQGSAAVVSNFGEIDCQASHP